MPLIIMKDENPPKDNHCKEKLMCHPIKCQQGEIEKKSLVGQCSLEG
jgi:hypothetical protein